MFLNFTLSNCIEFEFVALSQPFHQFLCVWTKRGFQILTNNVKNKRLMLRSHKVKKYEKQGVPRGGGEAECFI